MSRASNGTIGKMAPSAKTTVFSSSRSEPSSFTMLVNRINNPINARIITNSNMLRIDKNNFVILVSSILIYPVRVQYTKVTTYSTGTFFSYTAKISGEFLFIDTRVSGLTMNNTFVEWSLTATTTYSYTVKHISLFCFISKLMCFISSCGSIDFNDFFLLTIFPCSDTKKKAKNIALLLSPYFFKIFICTHF
mmetsp:Transcript_42613/g.117569  ORF Transcript_42613/g.117569 Transcript_42613/m.117569 type:complete len:192 (-) Transcript_42613:15-590(-)